MSDLKTWREKMAPPTLHHTNGMVVVITNHGPSRFSEVTQFESESAARFHVAAYHEVPALLARIEELERCSDPLLVNNLHADALRLEREKIVLVDRVKALEDQVAIEVNLRTKAQSRTQIAKHFAAKALEQAKDNDKLRAELGKERELRAAADKALEALESINEQVGPRIHELEAEIQRLRVHQPLSVIAAESKAQRLETELEAARAEIQTLRERLSDKPL